MIELPPTPEPTADETSAAIVIKHGADGTTVHGTQPGNQPVKDALNDLDFKWSRRQTMWYQRRSKSFDERDNAVRALRAAFDDLGVTYTYTGPGEEPEADGPPAAAQAAAGEPGPEHSADAPAAEPETLTRIEGLGDRIIVGHIGPQPAGPAQPSRLPVLTVTPPDLGGVSPLFGAEPYAVDADMRADVERLDTAFAQWSTLPTVRAYNNQDQDARPDGFGTPENPIAELRLAYGRATTALRGSVVGRPEETLNRIYAVAAWSQALEPAVEEDLLGPLQQVHQAAHLLAARSQATIEAFARAAAAAVYEVPAEEEAADVAAIRTDLAAALARWQERRQREEGDRASRSTAAVPVEGEASPQPEADALWDEAVADVQRASERPAAEMTGPLPEAGPDAAGQTSQAASAPSPRSRSRPPCSPTCRPAPRPSGARTPRPYRRWRRRPGAGAQRRGCGRGE